MMIFNTSEDMSGLHKSSFAGLSDDTAMHHAQQTAGLGGPLAGGPCRPGYGMPHSIDGILGNGTVRGRNTSGESPPPGWSQLNQFGFYLLKLITEKNYPLSYKFKVQ